jgi:hypothetical protein
LLKVIDTGGKVFNTTSSVVSQSGINDNNYSFDIYGTYTKSVGEDHKFVGSGNTIYKEPVTVCLLWRLLCPTIHGIMQYCAGKRCSCTRDNSCRFPMFMMIEGFSYFARLQYDYTKENTCCQVCFVMMHQQGLVREISRLLSIDFYCRLGGF